MSDDLWTMLHAERAAFVDYLETLPSEDWEHPSLCEGWRVHDVVAHLVAGAKMTVPAFLFKLITAGFSFDRMTAKDLQNEVGASPAQLTAALKSLAARKTQPGKAMLGEIVIHGEDVRRGLGQPAGSHPINHVRTVADYYKNAGPPIGAKGRIAGLTLEATNNAWSTGEGPVVSGPLLSLLLAMSGRRAALDDLTGPGRDELASRL